MELQLQRLATKLQKPTLSRNYTTALRRNFIWTERYLTNGHQRCGDISVSSCTELKRKRKPFFQVGLHKKRFCFWYLYVTLLRLDAHPYGVALKKNRYTADV